MQSTSEGCLNITELANQLIREKLFINSERQLLQKLNEEVESKALEMLQVSWVCTQQRQNLTNLITSRSEADSITACQRASLLERVTFVDAYKVLKYKEASTLAELLDWLKQSPLLVALCLLHGEEHMPEGLPTALVSGLYGSAKLSTDRTQFLSVIRALIKYQMAPSNDPQKFFRTSKCALASLYAVFKDNHMPAHRFLVAVLQAPIMAVLHEDEFFLDIDPDKAMERFTQPDRLKKFGQPNSTEYAAKVARYRKWTIQSLFNLTNKFITSLRDHWPNFPSVIAWIVQQIIHLLKQHSSCTNDQELHVICTEMVLHHYICPAIVNPEAHGVVDVPVSFIARFNLIQIAQIIQMLSLSKYQEVDLKVRDLYAKFDRSCVWSLVENVASVVPVFEEGGAVLSSEGIQRTTAALYTAADAHQLISFLKRISSKLNNNTPDFTGENPPGEEPTLPEVAVTGSSSSSEAGGENGVSWSEACAGRVATLLQTLQPNYRSHLHDLLKKMPDWSQLKQISSSEPKEPVAENGHSRRGILSKVSMPRLPRSTSANAVTSDEKFNGSLDKEEPAERLEVMVIKLTNLEESDYLGLLPESKVLENYYGGSEAGDADDTGSALVAPGPAPVQKRTRFSVSHDEVSLGNTSDNLEAVSEAASNHSVTSSLELENEDQNDNLSDMVSANVSGRGSPNISGRETPSSQVTDTDAPLRSRPPQNPQVSQAAAQAKILKQTRNDIEDKFCKFDIKKLMEGDETISIMSDTWSTDVLASDSETIGDSCDQTQVASSQGGNTSSTVAPDASETASESAWSVDVLASDSDRNTEGDTDDCVSVAARSDTSWPRRPDHHDDQAAKQNGIPKRPDVGSPRHVSRPGLSNRGGGYLSATAALSRGGELGLQAQPTLFLENRKSILVNGYPIMTCYAMSAPESPSTSTPAQLANDVFDFIPQESSQPESTLEGSNSQSDAISQWVDDSFPTAQHSPDRPFPSSSKYNMPSASKTYDENELMDRSLNSSESSFNALSVSQYDRRYDSGIDTQQPESRSTITDLMTRMSSATISTSANLVNNLTSRIVKSEMRTSIVNISSSRVDKKREVNGSGASASGETSQSSSVDAQSHTHSDSVTERRISPPLPPPPLKTASTGAIPKSISFDATADKSQRRRVVGEEGLAGNLDELKNNVKRSGGALLHKIKMFRQKGRSQTQPIDMKVSEEEVRSDDGAREGESSEDILAKYRRPPVDAQPKRRVSNSRRPSDIDPELDKSEGVVDLNDPEVFNSMKRKLRMVLSNSDLYCVEYVPNRCTSRSLVEWVRAAGSRAGGAAGAAAGAAAEAVGGALTAGAAPRLAAALRADLAARRPYAVYLANSRATLTHATRAHTTQINNIRAESQWCGRATAAARVLELLEKGVSLRRLARDRRGLSPHTHLLGGELMDEKASRLTASIKAIIAEVKADPSWEGGSQNIIEMVELTVERAAFARLYLHVLFPNGDTDIARDQVLSEHIRRLSACTSAARAGVRPRHLWAAPFPRAQALLRQLAVYRTPRDKVSCIMRCVTSLMAVLGLAEGESPSADDLTPVLVYVIIKVNPQSLLSTLELVSALGGAALQGEALYWWTQFCAAVAYIKTMDYPRS